MKKVLGCLGSVILVIILGIVLLFQSCGSRLGIGDGSGDGKSNSKKSDSTSVSTPADVVENNTKETTLATETTPVKVTVAISVVEKEYFYQNQKIDITSFIEELESIDEAFVVEVTDDNASLRAYNKLIDALDEKAITYTEK